MIPALMGLTEAQIGRVQAAVTDILARTGFAVAHQGLRAMSGRAGAEVDDGRGVVCFPPELLQELLALVPASYTIRRIDGGSHEVGGEAQHCVAIVTDPWIIDYDSGEPRRPVLADLRRHTIVAQQLEEVVSVSRMDFPVADVEGPCSSLRALQEHLTYHHKHVLAMPADLASFEQWLQIGSILCSPRPLKDSALLSIGVAVISPLTLSQLNGELLIRACEQGFPIVPTICPQAGTTSPYSLLGTVVQATCELVAMAALTQIARPGNPFLAAMGTSVADMRSGHDRYYTLDKVPSKLAGVQMALSYGLPSAAECGGTMTHRYDPQCGAEGMLFMLAAHASGCHMLSGIGSCANAVGMSAEMMVIQTAWLQAARHVTRGLPDEQFEMALDSIRSVGPGGNYLTDDLTLALLRSGEFFSEPIFDHSGGQGEGVPIVQRAHERVEEMVSGYQTRVPQSVLAGLADWFEERYRRGAANDGPTG